jgi:RNA polymerase sigma-54 factor
MEMTKLKPMILKDIADLVGLDISTISRVANSKICWNSLWDQMIKEFFRGDENDQEKMFHFGN